MSWVLVRIVSARGSVPRDAGAWMQVFETGQKGTIGGGALEYEAARLAREMLAAGGETSERVMPLGPGLGQCCGGAVTLSFEREGLVENRMGAPVWIWGAGHVGRALVSVLAPLPDFDVTWTDVAQERFPKTVPEAIQVVPAANMPLLMERAPENARHVILTYSHDLDLDLCDAALRRGFEWCGLIGSTTKWARFRSRLKAMGHEPQVIDRITCPIGNPDLGKHPQEIAVGVAAAFLQKGVRREQRALEA